MVNRRQFIETGAAAAFAGAALAGIERAAADPRVAAASVPRSGPERLVHPRLVVIDERFAAARRFGAAMQWRGLPVHAIRGDVTEVWYERLHPLWKRTAAPVAGITAYAAMFCLERLAWDQGLRMIHREALAADATDRPLHSWLIAAAARTTVSSALESERVTV
jgi:hypothetical protein